MTTQAHLRRLEHQMAVVRWFGVLIITLLIGIQRYYPDEATRRLAWVLLVTLALGNLVLTVVALRVRSERDQHRLGIISFAFNIIAVAGFVWVYTFEEPYVTWALYFLVPVEGALRYRSRGAIVAAVVVATLFIPQTLHQAGVSGTAFDITTYIFVVAVTALIAVLVGTMAENWHRKNLAFEEQSAQLVELDMLKDRYIAVTTHEIRGPLTAMITGLDSLKKRFDRLSPDQRERLLDMVSTQANQLARLVDDLMIGSELQAGRTLTLQPEWSDLQATIQKGIEGAATKRRAHQLELYVEPLRCEIDPYRVSQLVRNLVENAYKYTPDRTRVAVTAKAGGNGIVLEIGDEGRGIPPEKRDQLFDAFSRIEETAAGREGVGLGLFVVSQIVAAMDGRIDLASSSRGTTFTIHIPCRTLPVDQPHVALVQDRDERTAETP